MQHKALYFAEGGQCHRLVIPQNIYQHLSENSTTCHGGGDFSTEKTISRIEQFYFWNGMRTQITHHCMECIPCQLRKMPTTYHKQPLSPWPATTEPLAHVSVDIFGPIKMSRNGNTVVLVMIDVLTHYVWTHPLPNQTAPTVAIELINIFLDVGFPQQLVSDSGTNFTSNIMKELCQLQQIDIQSYRCTMLQTVWLKDSGEHCKLQSLHSLTTHNPIGATSYHT